LEPESFQLQLRVSRAFGCASLSEMRVIMAQLILREGALSPKCP